MKKKVLFITNNFWPENFRSNDIVNIISQKYDVSVLTGYPTYPTKEKFKNINLNDNFITNSKFKIYRVPTTRKTFNKFSTIINYISFIFLGSFLGTFLIKEKKFDYVICFASSPIYQALLSLLFSKLKKSKSILWIQDIWPETLIELGYIKNKYLIMALNKSIAFLYKKHDLILTQSKEYYMHLNKNYKNCNYLFNPCDKFDSEINTPKNINFNKDYKYLVYSGNIGDAQNFDLLLEAASIIKSEKLKFLLIGSGSKFKYIENKIKDNFLYNVELHEAISKKELSFVLQRADVLFISLKQNQISRFVIPAKFQTYTFFGKPILCQTDGDVKKMILDYKCGFVINNEKIESMVGELKKIINTKTEDLNRMGQQSNLIYNNYFNDKVFLKSLVSILDEI